jgi:hypothetical protein
MDPMIVRVRRDALKKTVDESAGWSVYDDLEERSVGVPLEQFLGDLNNAQRAVFTIGQVHLMFQWEGPLTGMSNLDATVATAAVDGAGTVGRPDIAEVLREVLALMPMSFGSPDFDGHAWFNTIRADEAERARWTLVEEAWFNFGLDLSSFVEAHASEFFADDV